MEVEDVLKLELYLSFGGDGGEKIVQIMALILFHTSTLIRFLFQIQSVFFSIFNIIILILIIRKILNTGWTYFRYKCTTLILMIRKLQKTIMATSLFKFWLVVPVFFIFGFFFLVFWEEKAHFFHIFPEVKYFLQEALIHVKYWTW